MMEIFDASLLRLVVCHFSSTDIYQFWYLSLEMVYYVRIFQHLQLYSGQHTVLLLCVCRKQIDKMCKRPQGRVFLNCSNLECDMKALVADSTFMPATVFAGIQNFGIPSATKGERILLLIFFWIFHLKKQSRECKMLKIPKILQCQGSTDSASSGSD